MGFHSKLAMQAFLQGLKMPERLHWRKFQYSDQVHIIPTIYWFLLVWTKYYNGLAHGQSWILFLRTPASNKWAAQKPWPIGHVINADQ